MIIQISLHKTPPESGDIPPMFYRSVVFFEGDDKPDPALLKAKLQAAAIRLEHDLSEASDEEFARWQAS